MHRRFAPFRVPPPRTRVAHECIVFAPEKIGESSGIIYHHSIGTELTLHVIAHRGPKFLIYHNITPAEFFEPY